MDFLVAGLGFGALLIIAGYAVREVGVFLFAPSRIRKQFPENQELASAWRRLIRAASSTAMIGGGVMWLLALLAVAVDLSDGSGAIAMASAATIVSVVGAGVIAVAMRQKHASRPQAADTQATTRIAPQPQAQPPADADAFEEWRPRVIGRASSTFADDMPAWGATYSQDEEPAAEVAATEAAPEQVEDQPTVETSEPVSAEAEPSAPEPEPETEPIVASDSEPSQPEASDASEPPAVDAVEETPEAVAAPAEAASEADAAPEAVAVEAIVEAPPILEPAVPAEPEPIEAQAEPTTESEAAEPVDDRVISEEPAPEPRTTGTQDQGSPRRFKSSLLADIDEPGAGEGNAAFKSAILADLSGVRLPDDVPRFRPTTLIDPPAREKAADNAKPNGSSNRR